MVFQRYHCTIYAAMKLVKDVKEGFNKEEVTTSYFIDLEKANDLVWREGFMVNLAEIRINGRM